MLDRTAPAVDTPVADSPTARARAANQRIGRRVYEARKLAGMTQEQLGAAVGVTFQQLQKYEKGKNNVSSGRLEIIAEALGRDVLWFHVDADEGAGAADHVVRFEAAIVAIAGAGDDEPAHRLVAIAREALAAVTARRAARKAGQGRAER